MPSTETTTYNSDNLIGGDIKSAVKTAKAGTYKRGQHLGRLDSSNVYEGYNAAGSGGVEKFRAVVAADRVLAAEGKISTYITGSELMAGGLKDNAGAALTVTTAIIEAAQDHGIIIKEK